VESSPKDLTTWPMTGTGQVSSDTTAFQQLAYFALRSNPMFEMVADVRSTAQSHNGSAVQFNIYNDLAQATSALTEASDVTAVQLGDSTVTVTLAEYGNAVVTTAKLRGTSFLNVDADAANIIGYNMVDSMDKIVSDVANGGTNVIYGGVRTSRGTITATDLLTADKSRQAVAELRSANAPGFENGNYIGMIHPDVAYDLRSETDVTDVLAFQVRQDASAVRNGSIGVFGGIEFIENPRAGLIADGGSGSVDVYQTLICGRQALAKAYLTSPWLR
jgi:N4-gp56 family major capsid protein